MKLTNLTPSDSPSKAVNVPAEGESKREVSAEAARPADRASVSSLANAVEALGASQARIEELQKQYLEGSYQVDAQKVSARILDAHLNQD